MHTGYERAWRRWDVAAVVGLAGWLLLDLTGRTLFGSVPWPQSVVDYRIMYDASRHVAATHQYPAGYPYPPPAVAAHAASAALPFAASASLWLALTGLAAAAIYFTLARALELHRRPGLLLLLPLAHVGVAYYFQWDMRSVNCNLIVLAAVVLGCAALARGRDARAGAWFALAVALKVFPVLVLPYLAWTRRWRALASALACSLVLWLIVPAAAFGPGFGAVYRGWGDELTRATDPATKNAHPILISLDKAAAHLAAGDASRAHGIRLGVCAAWVAVGIAGAGASWGNRALGAPAVLTHVSLLVLGPVAVNPYLEAYHLVPLVAPALVLLAVAADGARSPSARAAALAGFALGLVLVKVPNPWPLRGLLVNAQALVLCGAAVCVTRTSAGVKAVETEPSGGARRGRFAALLGRLAPRAKG